MYTYICIWANSFQITISKKLVCCGRQRPCATALLALPPYSETWALKHTPLASYLGVVSSGSWLSRWVSQHFAGSKLSSQDWASIDFSLFSAVFFSSNSSIVTGSSLFYFFLGLAVLYGSSSNSCIKSSVSSPPSSFSVFDSWWSLRRPSANGGGEVAFYGDLVDEVRPR